MDDISRFDGSSVKASAKAARRPLDGMSALQHREAGPPATAELFSDLLSNNTLCASGAACLPRQQRSIQHFSATPWLNVIAPAVWAPQRSRPCIRLQSLNSSDVDGCLFPRVVPRMVAWVIRASRHGQRDMRGARVTAVVPRRSSTPTAQRAAAPCVRRASFFARKRSSTARAKGR